MYLIKFLILLISNVFSYHLIKFTECSWARKYYLYHVKWYCNSCLQNDVLTPIFTKSKLFYFACGSQTSWSNVKSIFNLWMNPKLWPDPEASLWTVLFKAASTWCCFFFLCIFFICIFALTLAAVRVENKLWVGSIINFLAPWNVLIGYHYTIYFLFYLDVNSSLIRTCIIIPVWQTFNFLLIHNYVSVWMLLSGSICDWLSCVKLDNFLS